MADICYISDYLLAKALIPSKVIDYGSKQIVLEGLGSVMAAERSSIPSHMLEELRRLRASSEHVKEVESQEPTAVEKSLEIIQRAAELLKGKSDRVIELEDQLYAVGQENDKLRAMCDQAQFAIQELKRQLDMQLTRADSAENAMRRIENQLKAAEAAERESKENIARLTGVIEEAFGGPLVDQAPKFGSGAKVA